MMKSVYYNKIVNDIIEWDVKSWCKSLDYWKKESKLNLENSIGLELGSRNGGLSLWLALQGCRVVCSDLEGPTSEARSVHDKYGISNLIEYSSIDAKEIPFNDNFFDVVVFKSVLGGIGYGDNKEAQIQAINEMYRVLKPGGELLFAENLCASPIHELLRKKFVSWGKSWRYISINEVEEFLTGFSSVNYITTGFLSALGRSETQRSVLSLCDRVFSNRLVPDKWKYIAIGLAKK